MKFSNFRFVCAALFTTWMAACNLPSTYSSPDNAAIATSVAQTLQVSTPTAQQAPLASPTQIPSPMLLPSSTPTFGATSIPKPGSISGGIYGYPYGSVPSLTFVAFNQASSSYWYWIIPPGQSSYSTDPFIPPGSYQVIAYDSSGHAGGCTTIVTVIADQTSTCDITDWAGSYRSKPSGVP